MWSEEQVRAKFVEIATSYDGCSAQVHTDRFCDLIAPHGPEDTRKFFSSRVPGNTNSSCGVVSVGFLRELCRAVGLVVPELEGPLPIDWVSPVVALAKRYGCHIAPSSGRFPTVGCAYYVAVKLPDGSVAQHWRNVIAGTPGSGPFDTIDGGGHDGAGYQCIGRARPQLRGSLDVLSQKPIIFWIDCVKLVMALLAKVGAAGLPGAPVTIAGVGAAASAGVATGGAVITMQIGSSGPEVAELQRLVGATSDGRFGPKTEAAVKAAQVRLGLPQTGVVDASIMSALKATQKPTVAATTAATLPWVPGLLEREAKEPGFCRALLDVLTRAGANIDRVTALMAEESRYNPAAHNPAGGASGLMQWMPFLWSNPKLGPMFKRVAASADALRAMTATQQLPLVETTLGLWGKAGAQDPALAGWGDHIGSPDDTILATKDEPGRVAFYRDNAGYDRNKDGHITAGEVRAAVYGLLVGAASKPRIGADGRPVVGLPSAL